MEKQQIMVECSTCDGTGYFGLEVCERCGGTGHRTIWVGVTKEEQ